MVKFLKRYIRERAGGYIDYRRQIRSFKEKPISVLNRATSDLDKRSWLADFIEKRGIIKGTDKTFTIGTLYGQRAVLGWAKSDIRIFFSGENLHLPRWSHYADYMLSGPNPYDLGLGFDIFEDDSYLRFPLWIMYLFPPDATNDDIRRICKSLRYKKPEKRPKFCTLISRWDPNGVRKGIFDALNFIDRIDCPSDFLHNDDSLKYLFNDNKVEYMKQYRLNICPENSNAVGYTTEKIFQSISAGCIPIYYGNFGHPEPDVINPNATLGTVGKC